MIGCMVASSLAMAPALLLAGRARFVDLDGPLLLARDRPDGSPTRLDRSSTHAELWDRLRFPSGIFTKNALSS